MSRLSDIAVRVEAPARTGGLGGGVQAVLSELLGMLETLTSGGKSATIDLRSLPMSPQDRIELQSVLGEGELQATLSADGISTLRETGVSGVWWIAHHDREGELIAELIEVTTVPAILEASLDDVAASARTLRQRLLTNPQTSPRAQHAKHS
jgi:hydrogenase-1 operon protein HyaF